MALYFMYNQTTAKYKLVGLYGKNVVQGPEDVTATVNYVRSFTAPLHYEVEGRISTDITAPVTEAAVEGLSGEGLYNKDDVKVKVTASDGDGLGVKETQYRINQGEWGTVNGGAFTISAEGRNAVEYRSIDNAGSIEPAKQLIVAIDKTAPTIQNPGKVTLYPYETVSLSVYASDHFSGIRELKLTLDGNPVIHPSEIAPLTWGHGTHTVKAAAQDLAGNQSEITYSLEVIMDLDHFDELIQAGADAGKITDRGIENSLLKKVKSAQADTRGNKRKDSLGDLAQEVKAQSGKKIDKAFADLLLTEIKYIQPNGYDHNQGKDHEHKQEYENDRNQHGEKDQHKDFGQRGRQW